MEELLRAAGRRASLRLCSGPPPPPPPPRRLQVPPLPRCRMTSSSSTASVAAVVQMRCTADKERNLSRGRQLILEAKSRGATVVFLPEAFDFVGESAKQTLELAETLEGPTVTAYRTLAAEERLALSLGGFHESLVDEQEGRRRVRNTHVLVGEDGGVLGRYSKTHLFDVDIAGGARLKESDYVERGHEIGRPVEASPSSGLRIGLGVCYDLRFPEFSLTLRRRGADVLTFPSAFTVATGMAHWEVLLRARAVETQCYVVAAAQCGAHNQKRSSYGHSMIIDPWGTVVAQCGDGEGVAVAPINSDYVESVRRSMPVMQHRRDDLYFVAADGLGQPADREEDGEESFAFGDKGAVIHRDCVVFRSPFSLAVVNRKPVLPGHLLVLPRRRTAVRMRDLGAAETADLFLCVRRAQASVEAHFGAASSTVSVQDGPEAGRTVRHLHVHVLPRKKGDFAQNDDVYNRLEKHDKEDHPSAWRTKEEMAQEAAQIKRTMEKLKL